MLSTIFVLCSLPLTVLPQQKLPRVTKGDVLISTGKPTIYISFEYIRGRKPLYDKESNQGVWLRLHNNTQWAISFCTLSAYIGEKITPLRLSDDRGALGLREGIEVNPCHEVEAIGGYESVVTSEEGMSIEKPIKLPKPPVGYKSGHVFSTSWLPPGRSVIFSVPREHLAKHLAIFISFNYEWETAERDSGSNEPEHRVYFHAHDLPDTVSKGKSEGRQR